jgi:hypothetical protein
MGDERWEMGDERGNERAWQSKRKGQDSAFIGVLFGLAFL